MGAAERDRLYRHASGVGDRRTIGVTHDLTLCSCCVMVLANDDRSGCDGIGHGHPAAPMSLLADHCPNVVLGDEDGEEAFSARRCDGCGETLAGSRYPAHVLGQI